MTKYKYSREQLVKKWRKDKSISFERDLLAKAEPTPPVSEDKKVDLVAGHCPGCFSKITVGDCHYPNTIEHPNPVEPVSEDKTVEIEPIENSIFTYNGYQVEADPPVKIIVDKVNEIIDYLSSNAKTK